MFVWIVKCDLISSLTQNVFSTKDFRFDPFEDVYLQTILHMDEKALLKMPILDDDAFLSQINEPVDTKNGELFSNEITM